MEQRNCPKHVEFYSKNKFQKLVHLVGFIIRIYHDARSSECQIGVIPEPLFKIARRYNGSMKIYISLGTIMEPVALFLQLLLLLHILNICVYA